jgi:hypothetical protein
MARRTPASRPWAFAPLADGLAFSCACTVPMGVVAGFQGPTFWGGRRMDPAHFIAGVERGARSVGPGSSLGILATAKQGSALEAAADARAPGRSLRDLDQDRVPVAGVKEVDLEWRRTTRIATVAAWR